MRREKSRILDGDTTDFANREKRQERRDKREETREKRQERRDKREETREKRQERRENHDDE